MNKKRHIIFDSIVLIIISAIGCYFFREKIGNRITSYKLEQEKATLPEAIGLSELHNTNANTEKNLNGAIENTNEAEVSEENKQNANTDTAEEEIVETLPAEINIDVPFTSQAPYANWDLPYQEACEEASALTVYYFYEGKIFTPKEADEGIRELVDFQTKNYGSYKDTTAEETARFIRDIWGYKTRVEAATIDGIKKELAGGKPVMVPAAGRQLGNQFFSGEGPLYHMLVIRGYTKDGKFITNDPGTKRGESYIYDEEVLLSAIHDWNGGDVGNGEKFMIIMTP